MLLVRVSKTAMVAAIALFASLVAFGNITDYGTNFVFVQHVLSMDSIFPDATIKYRAITSPTLHHAAYNLIIAAETLTAMLCWIGAFRLLWKLRADATELQPREGVGSGRPDARLPCLAGRLHVSRRRVVWNVDVAAVERRARCLPLPDDHSWRVDLRQPSRRRTGARAPRSSSNLAT